MNIGTTNITNVYNKTVINNVTVTRVSYNGGSGGVQAQPTPAELAAAHAQHLPPTAAQQQQVQVAHSNPALRASANHGNPPIAATPKPGVFSGAGVVAARHGGTISVYHQGGAAERTAPTGTRSTAPAASGRCRGAAVPGTATTAADREVPPGAISRAAASSRSGAISRAAAAAPAQA